MAPVRQPGSTCALRMPVMYTGTIARTPPPTPDSTCTTRSSWWIVEKSKRLLYVRRAWNLANQYTWPAIVKHTGEDFSELIKGLLPGLMLAAAAVVATTLAGAAVGGGIGFLFGGVGAGPGAIAGGELGLSLGLWLVEWLGLGFLVVYIGSALGDVSKRLAHGTVMAWESCGSAATIDAAAHYIADGMGGLFSLLLQGIVAFVAQRGMTFAVRRMSASRLGRGIAAFLKTKAFEEETISYYLKLLGKPKEPPLVRQRVGIAIRFFRDVAKMPHEEMVGMLKGIDFNSPVEVTSLNVGDIVGQNVRSGAKFLGNWFARVGYATEDLGLAKGNRTLQRFRIKRALPSLKSRSAGIIDSWTPQRSPDVTLRRPAPGGAGAPVETPGEMARGGGEQFFVPKPEGSPNFEGYLEPVTR